MLGRGFLEKGCRGVCAGLGEEGARTERAGRGTIMVGFVPGLFSSGGDRIVVRKGVAGGVEEEGAVVGRRLVEAS